LLSAQFLGIALKLLTVSALAGCGTQGSPIGGVKDVKGPVLLRANPRPESRGIRPSEVVFTFDEYLRTAGAERGVFVAPPPLGRSQLRLAELGDVVVVLVLGFVITLPIPIIGNMPPAIVIAVLAVSLIERDGLAVIFGIVLAIAVVALNFGVITAAVVGFLHAINMLFAPGSI